MSTQERVAVLDGALGQAYEDFDGFILTERSRAQRQSNAVGADPSGLYSQQDGIPGVIMPGQSGPGRAGEGVMDGGIATAASGPDAGTAPQAGGSGSSVGGAQGGPVSTAPAGHYPAPDDIPDGRGDDVVARQIREAAMNEPDSELRERLWDEYRRYTGLTR